MGTTTSEAGQRRTALPKDDVYYLLQNGRRRAVLRYLLERDREAFEMRDVAEAVAAWEHDTTVHQLTSDQRQRVYIALYQTHLPALDEHGVVDYDQEHGVVRALPPLAVFERFLEDGLHGGREALVPDDRDAGDTQSGLAGIVSLFS